MNRNGITAGGNWIVDKAKIIDDFPPQDGLCNILEEINTLPLLEVLQLPVHRRKGTRIWL